MHSFGGPPQCPCILALFGSSTETRYRACQALTGTGDIGIVKLLSGRVTCARSVQKPLDSQPNATEAQLQRQDLCDLLRRTAGLIWQFFREKKHAKGQTTSNQMGYSISRCPQGNFILIMNLRFVQTTIPQTRKEL